MMLPRVLTVAGSDSGGGAGIQADLKVMTAHSVYGLSVITAITSQNTLGVDAMQIMPIDMVEKQFRAVMDDIGCDVLKTGMLASEEIVKKLASLLEEYKVGRVVIDPVMASTSGSSLLDPGAIDAFISDLLPCAYILTPNVAEARLLVAESRGVQVEQLPETESLEDLMCLARELQSLGSQYVLVKGGHLPLKSDLRAGHGSVDHLLVADVLCGANLLVEFKSPWSPSQNTHGTGCSLASAIASNLALNQDIQIAVKNAIDYVQGAIASGLNLGSGGGPLNHMYRLQSLPFTPGHFIDYLVQHPAIRPAWRSFTEHTFVKQLADGSLPMPAFKHFLVQDYLYLKHYARLNALAAYKSENMDEIAGSAQIILHIKHELQLHLTYCEGFGISKTQLESESETIACTVYTRYMESIGSTKDWMSLQIALAACLHGYGEVGQRLYHDPITNRDSPYWSWIANYAADDYTAAVATGRALVEKYAQLESPTKILELVEIFRRVTAYEAQFWTSALENADE